MISARGVYVASRDRRRKIPRRVAKTSRDRRGIAAHAVVPSSAESVESSPKCAIAWDFVSIFV